MDLSSWQEGLLFGVPMVAMLLAMFFHLDELWTGPSTGVGRLIYSKNSISIRFSGVKYY